MRIRHLRMAWPGLLLALVVGRGEAQTTLPASQPATPAPASQPAEAPAEPPLQPAVKISPSDMTAQATKLIEKMKGSLKRVVELQEFVRRQKDVIKLNCVNDKLLQIKQLLNIGDAASTNMQEFIIRGDEDGRYHEFGRINIASQQVSSLTMEAEACAGSDMVFLGPTTVTVVAPQEPDDPTAPTNVIIPEVQAPPVASPFI